jgi:predicted nucleotidyltransferase
MVDIDVIKDEIIECLRPLDPEKVILFGSYANGNATEDSDIDLYIVTKDDFIPQNYDEKINLKLKVAYLLDSIRDKFSLDIVVHTKKMAQLFSVQNSMFYKEIYSRGKVLA